MDKEATFRKEYKRYKDRLHIALKAAKICIFEVDLHHQLYTFFENSEEIFGVPGETILKDVQAFSSLPPEEYEMAAKRYFSHPDDDEVIKKAFISIYEGKSATYVARMKAGATRYIWCKVDVAPVMEDGIPARMVGIITDIDGMKEREDQYKERAMRDLHTGLYNKTTTIQMIKNRLEGAEKIENALLMIDLDHFKQINDEHGHAVGDEILGKISKRLKEIFDDYGIIGRFGGDEFFVFAQVPSGQKGVSEKIQMLFETELGCGTTVSVGAAFSSQYGIDYNELFMAADRALYQAKKEGDGNTFVIG